MKKSAAIALACLSTGCFPLHTTRRHFPESRKAGPWTVRADFTRESPYSRLALRIQAGEGWLPGDSVRIDSIRFSQAGLTQAYAPEAHSFRADQDTATAPLDPPADPNHPFEVHTMLSFKRPFKEFAERGTAVLPGREAKRVWTLLDYITY